MSQSLSKLYIHIIFHVKDQSNTYIRNSDKDILYSYIGSIIKDNDSIPLIINGVEDHIHVFCIMSKNIALAAFIKEIKRHSSRWLKNLDNYYKAFKWQGGYGGFSVSPSLYDKTFSYIKHQQKHHTTMSFKDEYLLFLKEYGVEYNEEYLWM
ncbi:transposase [Labilibacter sediminis]|nr:transposase [Labilibacter sediminis]